VRSPVGGARTSAREAPRHVSMRWPAQSRAQKGRAAATAKSAPVASSRTTATPKGNTLPGRSWAEAAASGASAAVSASMVADRTSTGASRSAIQGAKNPRGATRASTSA